MKVWPVILCLYLALTVSACVSRILPKSEEIVVPRDATPVSYAHCYATPEAFYTVGGIRVKDDLTASAAKGFSFDLKHNAWKPWLEKDEFNDFGFITTAKIGGDIYVLNSDRMKPLANELRVYHSDTDLWEKLSVSDRIKARTGPSLTAVGEELVLFGGKTTDHNNNWGIYNTKTRQWRVFANYDGEISSHIALTLRSKVLIWGGFEKGKRSKNGFILDPSNGDVKALANMPFLDERANAKVVTTDEKLWIIGGMSDQGPKTDGAYYDDVFKNWKPIPSLPHPDRKDFEITLIPDRGILLWGGRNSQGAYVQTAYLLDLDTLLWSEVVLPNAPSPRIAHCLGTMGERVYIYGGIAAQPGEEKLWLIPFRDIRVVN